MSHRRAVVAVSAFALVFTVLAVTALVIERIAGTLSTGTRG